MTPSLRILCFGASLVRGHTQGGLRATPFAIWMKERLLEKWPDSDVSYMVDGMSGSLVTRDFKGRMADACDSLTAGYTAFGTTFTPYAGVMKDALQAWFNKRAERRSDRIMVETVVDGVSGDLIDGGTFRRRIEKRYERSSTRRPLYDWAIILGGTNDLGWGKPLLDIHDALTTVSDIALENGAKVLLCTVPECEFESESLDKKRDGLNAFIRSDMRDDVYVFDLKEKIPYHSLDEIEREEIWDDSVHFTSKGYERFGRLVAERLIEIIEAEEAEGNN